MTCFFLFSFRLNPKKRRFSLKKGFCSYLTAQFLTPLLQEVGSAHGRIEVHHDFPLPLLGGRLRLWRRNRILLHPNARGLGPRRRIHPRGSLLHSNWHLLKCSVSLGRPRGILQESREKMALRYRARDERGSPNRRLGHHRGCVHPAGMTVEGIPIILSRA